MLSPWRYWPRKRVYRAALACSTANVWYLKNFVRDSKINLHLCKQSSLHLYSFSDPCINCLQLSSGAAAALSAAASILTLRRLDRVGGSGSGNGMRQRSVHLRLWQMLLSIDAASAGLRTRATLPSAKQPRPPRQPARRRLRPSHRPPWWRAGHRSRCTAAGGLAALPLCAAVSCSPALGLFRLAAGRRPA